ncbi:Ig-like domain-containing protein [Zoogloea sp.]|uniref:Ig-like domain-containing protein n=1 Tax=Zoogloea sp. TaxID=49181 RepID=UPI0035B3F86D
MRESRNPLGFEALEPRVLLSADLNPGAQILDTAVHSQIFAADTQPTVNLTPLVDADGTQVSLDITGPGSAQLMETDAGFSLVLSNTDTTTQVSIKLNGGDGRVKLTDLSASADVGELNLAGADLQGSALFTGRIQNLVLGDISNAQIDFNGAGDTSLVAGDILDSHIHAPLANLALTANQVQSSLPGGSGFSLASLRTLNITGDFGADLMVSGLGVSAYALGNVQVGGALSGGVWSVHGRGSSIQAGSASSSWSANLTGTLVQFVTRGDASGSLALASLQLLQIGGSARGFTLLVGADLGDDAALGGAGANADTFRAGTLARARISGALIDSRILVSLDPVNGIYGDGNDHQLGTSTQRVQEFTVGGQVSGSNIVAPAFPAAVKIGGLTQPPSGLSQIFSNTVADTTAPLLSAQLQNDTGTSSTDHVTKTPAVLLQIVEVGSIAAIEGRFGASGEFHSLNPVLQADGRYLLDEAALVKLAGGSLQDKAYTLVLRARDLAGNVSAPYSLDFTLDTEAPAVTGLALDPDSDSGEQGDLSTAATQVAITGQSAPGALIHLQQGDLSTAADGDGNFRFTDLALTLGVNRFDFTAIDRAGNISESASLSIEHTLADSPPTLSARLLNDTGSRSDDGLTRDPTIIGQVSDNTAVSQLLVALDPQVTLGLPTSFTDLSALIQPDGSFTLDSARLSSLAGGSLAEASHMVVIRARDGAGNQSEVSVTFTLDLTPANLTHLNIEPASGPGDGGEWSTSADTIRLSGSLGFGAYPIEIPSLGLKTTSSGEGGAFSFSDIPLGVGDNTISLVYADDAGNSRTQTLFVRRLIGDTSAPTLSAGLADDSGSFNDDHITRNPTITGTAGDNTGLAQFLLALDGGVNPTYTDYLSLVQTDGQFTVGADLLASLAGGSVADGPHTLAIRAQDAAGNTTDQTVSFTLLSTAPVISGLGLDADSDTGSVGDGSTTQAAVTLKGSTRPGAVVRLVQADRSTTADNSGLFSFTDVALELGDNTFSFQATDVAGNSATASTTITRTAGDTTTAPTLTAALVEDTGSSNTDGITNKADIAGKIVHNVAVTQLQLAVDGDESPVFSDVLHLVDIEGNFTLTQAQLAEFAGGSLTDGAHSVVIRAVDAAGNQTSKTIRFTLDTSGPDTATFGIASADALDGNDGQTGASRVVLRGQAQAGAIISLSAQGLSTVASQTGSFQLVDVQLNEGDNALSLLIADAAGNTRSVSRTLTKVVSTRGDAVLDWNTIALQSIQRDATDPPVATRILAIQSIAVYDTLAAIEGMPAFMVQRTVTGPVSADAAVIEAAYRVLYQLYPAQRSLLDDKLATSLAAIADGDAKEQGIALGRSIADAVLASRANDGYLSYTTEDGSTVIGKWRPTGPMYLVADNPQWGSMTPFVLTSGDQFRAPPPPSLDSAEYAAAINQVQSLGSASSTTRTADQTQQALFWADGGGSYTPPGHWDQIAAQVAQAKGNSLSANARLFAQLNVALADAAIACWDTKYYYDAWRPETAIQNADLDGNADTTADANWRSLLITPPHPDYVSGHSTFSVAAAGILAATFGDATAFSTTSATLPGVSRSFTRFSQAADEAGMSRIYGGIHTTFANAAGQEIGAKVASAVLARFNLSEDTQAPAAVLDSIKAASSSNLTISGQLLDNLSGVVSAHYGIDSSELQTVSFDGQGKFNINTSFSLDGSEDGSHSLTLIAQDAAGNISSALTHSFILDTQAPDISLSTLADGSSLDANSRLTGSANPTGSALVQLSYSIDGGASRSLIFDSTGGFDQAITLGNLSVGDHTLSLVAQDAAGNLSTLTRSLKLDALAPLTVTKVTPTDGSGDVGVTFRPQVYFSRAVNAATLNSDSFYATGPDGSKLDTTIVPALDGSFAWLFFNSPMPGSSTVTLHLKGASIRAAADGSFLDADGDGTGGGDLAWSFTTVSTSSVLGAKLSGKVVDPGVDLLPMTFDDIRRGPDGVIHTADDVFLNPIVHAKVYIVGRSDLVTYTDANGNFSFDSVPVGDVKVGVDGRTATNAPTGIFWPEMVMDVTLKPGITNTVMGSMGSTESQQDNATRQEVYLPRVQTSALQTVSTTAPTTITVDDKSAPALTDEQRSQLTLTVAPNSAVGSDGQVLSDVKIGINTVPPELVKDMLPPGVLEHTFDITIQAPGVDTFTQPLQITFPNVFNADPGTKLSILSFDHTTGKLVINGTATVSADGKTVVSDEGSGVMAPGWHGIAPVGTTGQTPDIPYRGPFSPDENLPPSPPKDDPCFDWIEKAKAALRSAGNLLADLAKVGVDVVGVKEKYERGLEIYKNSVRIGQDIQQLKAAYSSNNNVDTFYNSATALIRACAVAADAYKEVKSFGKPGWTDFAQAGQEFLKNRILSLCSEIEAIQRACGNDPGVKPYVDLLNSRYHEAENLYLNYEAIAGPALFVQNFFTKDRFENYLDIICHTSTNIINDLEDLREKDKDGFGWNDFWDSVVSVGSNLWKAFDQQFSGAIDILGVQFANIYSYFSGEDFHFTIGDALKARAANGATSNVNLSSQQNYEFQTLAVTTAEGDPFAQFLQSSTAILDGFRSFVDGSATAQELYRDSIVKNEQSRFATRLHGREFYLVEKSNGNGTPARGNFVDGAMNEISLESNSEYFLKTFDPVTGDTGISLFKTGPSGTSITLPTPVGSTYDHATDSDGDGLSDFAEDVVGSNPNRRDSLISGISDSDSVRNGLDIGIVTRTGIISSVSLSGNAQGVSLAASNDNSRLTAYVACGSDGLAIVDVSNFSKPKVLARLNLSGDNTDVEVDATRGFAVMAAGDAGLHLVDISNAQAPKLIQTIEFGASVSAVQVGDGLAFVSIGTDLGVVNIATGEVLQTLNLSGLTITSLSLQGSTLFSVDAAHTLRSFAIQNNSLTALSSLALPAGGGRLFVGGNVAYIGRDDGFNGGFSTVDVSDPANLRLLSAPDANNIAGDAIVANGSGLAVAVGRPGGVFGTNVLDVVNVSDPTKTDNFVTRYNLPAAPKDVAIANGLAFVADGTGGLQIVNYASFDTKGKAPTVTVSLDAVDADPATAGIQVLEGRTLTVRPTVTDDVQVRNVELLVNGQVVANDASFPFDFVTRAPAIAQGGNTLTIQVRATDTGGNSTQSDAITLTVVPDTFPPVLKTVSVDEGARRFFVKSVDFQFDEPLDVAKLNTSGVALVRAGADGKFGTSDDATVPITLDTRSQGQVVSVLPGGYLPPGDYQLTISPDIVADAAGNTLAAPIVRHFTIRPASDVKAELGVAAVNTAPSANPGQQIGIAVPFDPSSAKAQFATIDGNGNKSSVTVSVARWDVARGIAYFTVPTNAVTGDNTVYSLVGGKRTDFADGTFPLQIVPVVSGVRVQSVSSDGTSAVVVLTGVGFVEGNGSEYRLGSTVVQDLSTSAGPKVGSFYVGGQYYPGVQVTVPLSDGAFGPISVKTAGGVSASFTSTLTGISASALSGTPADASQASANPGQAITLTGTGLSTATDVLMRYTDASGALRMVQLNPTAATQDGTSATLQVPTEANGAFRLQVFGSSAQPVLQIVPVLTHFNGSTLAATGLVEGASRYDFAGQSITDTQVNAGVDVASSVYWGYDPSRGNLYSPGAYLDSTILPHFGPGALTVTTAGGTSAALGLNSVRPGSDTASIGNLADVAVDANTGTLWVVDANYPGHLLRIDPSSGSVVQTLTLDDTTFGGSYTSNYAGLQVLPQAMSLDGTAVAAGSLLLFNGAYNQIVAINPGTGAVIKHMSLEQSAVAGLFDARSGHLFILSGSTNQLIEFNPADGNEIGRYALPINIQSNAGIAIDPTDGNFWIGSSSGGTQLVKIDRKGIELGRFDLGSEGFSGTLSGLAFAADGTLRVASSDGMIYRASLLADPATPAATLSAITARNTDGVAAQANQAAANVGQVIELVGSNFGAGTQVLFNTRDNAGTPRVVAVTPLLINDSGSRLQVTVPDLATTGEVRVSNVSTRNLGFNSYADSIHRQITTSFVAGSNTAVIRFADGGLESLDNESWGLDNVLIKQGSTTVFSDSFEGGAKANWSTLNTNKAETAVFSEFSGRFNNASQTLNLTGLSAGQTYTLSFDLYALDSWDGESGSPDQIQVSVDGTPVLSRTISNSLSYAQTLDASAGIRLQIVPTLTGLSGTPGKDSSFTLQGSGFMEGASTITVGGINQVDGGKTGTPDVSGSRNSQLLTVLPLSLDGPVRISTEGGYAELAAPAFGVQPTSAFTGITASAASGIPADPAKASANTGQSIVLTGQNFTGSTLVQFQGVDDSGKLGTLTRSGSVSNNGTTLTVEVPALARSGKVSVLGSNASFDLQIVPSLRALSGTVATGNTLILEGTGLAPNDLQIQIDGQGVGSFTVRTVNDGPSSTYPDQQLITLTVPAGVGAGVITVSTAGGRSVLRGTLPSLTALPDQSPAADMGDTLATALNPGLGLNESVKIAGSVNGTLDVDLIRLDLTAGDQLALFMGNNSPAQLRIFDANGQALANAYRWSNDSTVFNWTAQGTGSVYVGVSGYNNTSYDPKSANSGNNGNYTGAYTLNVERLAAGSSHLTGISATATSGTPAVSGAPSANIGQTITLNGTGLLSSDRVVFTTQDDSGQLGETSVTPTVLSADGESLSVVIPQQATTGRIRLERDSFGVFLQIVPTLSDVTGSSGNPFMGGTLSLQGSGFTQGSSVLFGNQSVGDLGRNYGTDIYSKGTALYLTVPAGMPTGPIRVQTLGGTSSAFGMALSSVGAVAGVGSPADGSLASANPGQTITLNGVGFDSSLDVVFETVDSSGQRTEQIVRPIIVSAEHTQAQVVVPTNAVTGKLRLVGDNKGQSIDLQIVPVVSGVRVQSVSSDGTSAVVVLTGVGFVEGNGSEYRLGSTVVQDLSTSAGPKVGSFYVGGQYYPGVQVTVPLSDGAFGPISVKTAGGVSASFTSTLTGISASALSGTPADASQASANPGQAITLTGTGLSTATDVLMRYTDASGALRMVQLNPTAATQDGTSATLQVPTEANGAFRLQVFGSSAQPVLQIVPVLTHFNGSTLAATGLVEGASRYDFAGQSITDTQVNAGVDVASSVYWGYDPSRGNLYSPGAYLDSTILPHFGPGALTVTTAGGTSAALGLNSVRPGSDTASIGNLADVAVDANTGTLWVVDANYPGHLLRIDPSSGSVVQTLTLDDTTFGGSYTSNYAGLQVLPQAMSLDGTAVAAGSLLLFNGAYNQIVAINPGTGAVIKHMSLEQSAVAGLFDARSGHLFILSGSTNQLIEFNPADGNEIGRYALPINIQSNAGIAIDPTDGNFWIGSSSGGTQLVKIDRKGIELGRFDLGSEGFSGTLSGLAFAADGTLRVASSDGMIYRASLLADPATPAATLSAITARNTDGVAAQANQAAANVGQVIELVGSNFGAGTQVLFNTRDNAGTPRVVAVTPLLINDSGSRLQVTVPDLATTGEVRVSNVSTRNLGFNSYADSIHRQITTSFVAGSNTAVIRFADGGLESLDNESWGLDNVLIKQGSTTVFSDSFEGGAKANWSTLNTNKAETAVFSEFSGRFNNASQTLNLTGLSAGQTYTLSFDLYALDSWDGESGSPDQIQVSVDGTPVLSRTISNSLSYAQTLDASAGIRLQIVPTLTGLSGTPGKDSSFTLQGSGFMEGASTITVGGINQVDGGKTGTPDVSGSRNSQLLTVLPLSLDGPVRISTEGGYAELAAPAFGVQPTSAFTGITASAASGIPADPAKASANTGQSIVLTGQNFTGSTLVQFQGVDDSGKLGTLTRSGSVSNNGTTLTVEVPALARSGKVSVLGSNASFDLQIVPSLRALSGTVATGNTLILEGTGLAPNDLQIQIDGQGVGSFTVRTVNDGPSSTYPDQQLITLTVPAGVGAGVITVSTAGGRSVLRGTLPSLTALPDQSPAADMGDTLATALNPGLGLNESVKIAGSVNGTLDVDLIRLDLTAGDQLALFMGNNSPAQLRIFDANGQALANAYRWSNDSTVFNWTAQGTGSVYVGVSGYNNTSYDPKSANSGNNGNYTGAYTLNVERLAAGSSHLTGISATATSGTPAVSGAPSANIGQTITLNGTGLLSSDRVVFTVRDPSGRLSYLSAAPTAVAADGKTLTVSVPQSSSSGGVRLDRDSFGIYLQVV